MKILGTGLSGLVGSRVIEILEKEGWGFESLNLSTGFDVSKKETLEGPFSKSGAKTILHLAAKASVDGCEGDERVDKETWENGKKGPANTAWAVNVLGTKNVVDLAKKFNKKIVYISTDFVFDGKKDFYTEDDMENPINWYGKTKYEGERIIRKARIPYLIIRIAYPYRAIFAEKMDFFRGILARLRKGEKITAVTDHIFTPTFIDDIAKGLKILINNWDSGIYHLVGSQSLTPFEAAKIIARKFSCNEELVIPVKRGDFFKNRAQRPFKLALENDKIRNLGFAPCGFEEGLIKVKEQIKT